MTNLDILLRQIGELHTVNAVHRRRGYRLQEVSSLQVSVHLVEEANEVVAELAEEHVTNAAVLEEMADVLATFLHLVMASPNTVEQVAARASLKLVEVFTTDPAEMRRLARRSGTTRRNRRA